MRLALRRFAAAVVPVVSVVIAAPASAGPPIDVLRTYVDRLLVVMEDPALKTPGHAAERHRAVRALAENALDFGESARRALGAHWEERTPIERDRFARLFANLIDQAYLARLSVYGERVVLDSETVDGMEAVVNGRALSRSGGGTPVEFHLHQGTDGGWRIYDVSFEGMSLVGNYRAQFNKIIRTSSFEALVYLLEAKTGADAQESTGEELKTAP
jgi:phospholipid transport system substrate-binding protein